MALKLVKRNKLPVKVKGSLVGEDGEKIDFSFTLHCKRLKQDEVDKELNDKGSSVKAFLFKVTEGWDDMLDEDGKPMPYTVDNFDAQLNETAGLHGVCYQAYMQAVGAAAKN